MNHAAVPNVVTTATGHGCGEKSPAHREEYGPDRSDYRRNDHVSASGKQWSPKDQPKYSETDLVVDTVEADYVPDSGASYESCCFSKKDAFFSQVSSP